MSEEAFRRYEWVTGIEAWTVAVIRGRTVDEVIGIYGGDPSMSVGDLTFAELDERHRVNADVEFHLQVLRHGDFVVAVESDGYSGAFPEIARRCSSGGGAFFSVYWNIHAAGTVTQAADGAVEANFESLYPLAPDEKPWERRPQWAIGAAVEPDRAWQVCMAQLEQQTGVTVAQEWLTTPHPAYRIPDPYRLYQGIDGADRA